LSGLNLPAGDLKQLLAVDIAGWKKEIEDVAANYAKLGLLAAVAMFFAPAARAADTTNATISILVVEQGDHRPIFLDFMSRLRQVLTTNLPSHVVFYGRIWIWRVLREPAIAPTSKTGCATNITGTRWMPSWLPAKRPLISY
jgi:hypothetical protein